MKRGDLVYIPSEVVLTRYYNNKETREKMPEKNQNLEIPTELKVLEKPANVIILETFENQCKDGYCEVLYQGKSWFVKQGNVVHNAD